MIGVEEFMARAAGRFPALLGLKVQAMSAEQAVVTMDYRREVTMSYGLLHGGALAGLADTAAAAAMHASLEPGRAFTTIELNMKILRGVREGTVTAVATPVHLGQRTAVIEVKVTDTRGKLVATFSCTQLLLESPTG